MERGPPLLTPVHINEARESGLLLVSNPLLRLPGEAIMQAGNKTCQPATGRTLQFALSGITKITKNMDILPISRKNTIIWKLSREKRGRKSHNIIIIFEQQRRLQTTSGHIFISSFSAFHMHEHERDYRIFRPLTHILLTTSHNIKNLPPFWALLSFLLTD